MKFLAAGKKRLAGDTARRASSPEVKDLRAEAAALRDALADVTLENRSLKQGMIAGRRSLRPWTDRPLATATAHRTYRFRDAGGHPARGAVAPAGEAHFPAGRRWSGVVKMRQARA